MPTAQEYWNTFLAIGANYMCYANNRAAGVVPTTNEASCLTNMRVAYGNLTGPQQAYYTALGGPNFLMKHLQSTGGFRQS